MKKYLLEAIVFIVGAAVMILEITAARVLAPYLGTSIVTWTSIIGVVLASLSLGYFLGGKLADRGPSYKTFSLIIFAAALFVGLVSFFKESILVVLQAYIKDIRLGSSVASIILFTPSSALLGMVFPYAVRLKIKTVKRSGSTVGSLYAISTVGSIFGTFLAGFFLIPAFGNTKILQYLGLVLIPTSFLAYWLSISRLKIVVVVILLLSAYGFNFQGLRQQKGIIDIDSQYNRIWIYQSVDGKTGRPVQNLKTDAQGIQSSMYLDRDNDLVVEYTKYYRLIEHFAPDYKNVLMIGGGGYSYPKDYLKRDNQGQIDVVEIDSKMTELARKYFNLKDSLRLNIYHQDGRVFLNRTKKKYDAILIDVFESLDLPYQLTTKEAIEKMYRSLNDDGVIIVNIVSSLKGKYSLFLQAEYLTYKKIFPQVYLFPVQDPADSFRAQNIILVAAKSAEKLSFENKDKELSGYLKHRWGKEVETNLPVLIDDHSPVDYYMIPVVMRE